MLQWHLKIIVKAGLACTKMPSGSVRRCVSVRLLPEVDVCGAAVSWSGLLCFMETERNPFSIPATPAPAVSPWSRWALNKRLVKKSKKSFNSSPTGLVFSWQSLQGKCCLKSSALLPISGFIFEILHTELKYCYICGLGSSLLIPYEMRVPKNS